MNNYWSETGIFVKLTRKVSVRWKNWSDSRQYIRYNLWRIDRRSRYHPGTHWQDSGIAEWNQLYEWFERFSRCWINRQSHVTSLSLLIQSLVECSAVLEECRAPEKGHPSIWDTHGISVNVFANPIASSSSPHPQELNPWSSGREEPICFSYLPDTFYFLDVVDNKPVYFRWGPWHPGRERASHRVWAQRPLHHRGLCWLHPGVLGATVPWWLRLRRHPQRSLQHFSESSIIWLRGRSWRFEIHLWRNIVRFWKSHLCSNKLDVQETNCCFSQFNRIWNHLSGHWTEIGWVACSGITGSNRFCSWKCFSYWRWIGATW